MSKFNLPADKKDLKRVLKLAIKEVEEWQKFIKACELKLKKIK